MRSKAFTLMILPTFVLFTSGCTTWKQADAKTLPKPPSSGTPVLSVVKTSGELIQFSKGSPGRVQGEFIAGRASNVTPAEVSIPLTEVQRIYYRRSNPTGTVLLVAGLAGATAIMAIAVANMKLDPGPILQGLKRR